MERTWLLHRDRTLALASPSSSNGSVPGAFSPRVGPALAFSDVSKTFPDGTRCLDSVSFDLQPNEFVSIVGPSGCGKSTLLKIASGLTPATSGAVSCSDNNLGYVFQDPTLLPWRTVRGNVELLAELHGVSKPERSRLAMEALRLVDLTDFADHHPRSLSGGMRMRVSLARSLTLSPPIFLFDEPFAALDEMSRTRLNDELLNLFVLEGFAGLFITHSITEAIFLSTRVHVMSPRPGRITETFDIPFPYPRPPSFRYDPEFAALAGQVSTALRAAHS
jgi:NitT/TauT family transport system ATP-binding protein